VTSVQGNQCCPQIDPEHFDYARVSSAGRNGRRKERATCSARGVFMSKFQSVAIALTSRLHDMETRVRNTNAAMCAPEDADMSDQAVMDAVDEPLAALSEAGIAEIASIKSALARIENGSYGVCSNCGDAIHAGRMEAMPTAAQCVSCAEESDRLHHRL
jgi:RNA polymerase-binding transcription factor DksA